LSQTRFHIAAKINKWDAKLGHSPLANFAKLVHPEVSEGTLKYIDEHCFHCNVKKKMHLLKAGETCEYLFLVLKGAFRGYVKEDSKELVTWITLENEMITSIRGLYSPQPSFENIQAIEDAELIGASYADLHYLYEHHLDMNIVGRKLLEKYCLDAEERSYNGRLTNATSRYNHFIATKGNLADRIPLKYIASYLGITIETLSRIRSNTYL
jgi:CRP-like cAMP-binding protein